MTAERYAAFRGWSTPGDLGRSSARRGSGSAGAAASVSAQSGRRESRTRIAGSADAEPLFCAHAVFMYARQVEENANHLRALRHEELELAGLTVICFGLALIAHGRPSLALPLLAAGITGVVRGVHAFWLRWDLLDRLLLDPDAYTIAEVHEQAARIASLESRRSIASAIRWRLESVPALQGPEGRLHTISAELEDLACALEDEQLEFDLGAAVVCEHLLSEGASTPLVTGGVSPDEALARIRHIRAGFTPASAAPQQ